MKIVIPGGAGHVGRLLAAHFHEAGHSVTVLSRQPHPAPWQMVAWNGRDPGDWHDTLHGADLVINLAGRSVNCRYNPRNRREILDSRVQSTEAVGRAIARAAAPPAIWMNASTATIYRHVFARPMDESTGELGGSEPDAPASWRFSIQVATSWERAFFAAATPHTRRIALRSAMIMSPEPGGIFATLLALVRTGLGGAAGSGRQFISWIHYQDFLGAVEHLVAHTEIAGVVNLCAPAPLPNREFMRMLREAARVRIGLPGPKPLLELGALFLRTETELILKSRRVIPARLAGSGFVFRFPGWREAAEDLLREVLQRDGD